MSPYSLLRELRWRTYAATTRTVRTEHASFIIQIGVSKYVFPSPKEGVSRGEHARGSILSGKMWLHSLRQTSNMTYSTWNHLTMPSLQLRQWRVWCSLLSSKRRASLSWALKTLPCLASNKLCHPKSRLGKNQRSRSSLSLQWTCHLSWVSKKSPRRLDLSAQFRWSKCHKKLLRAITHLRYWRSGSNASVTSSTWLGTN